MTSQTNTVQIQSLIHQLIKLGDAAPLELAQKIVSHGDEAVEPLLQILRSEEYWSSTDYDGAWWAPIHAVFLLGAIGAEEAIPNLIDTINRDIDWIDEALPSVFGSIGPAAIEPLKEALQRTWGWGKMEWYPQTIVAGSLTAIALRHTEACVEITRLLSGQLEIEVAKPAPDTDYCASLVSVLSDLRDETTLPVIHRAFESNAVDTTVINQDDVAKAFRDTSSRGERYFDDPLRFYDPREIRRRQERWEAERIREAEARRKWEENVAGELRRLEYCLKHSTQPPVTSEFSVAGRNTVRKKVGRNDPCPCGSGKKYKRCCLNASGSLPAKVVLSSGSYASPGYLDVCEAADPILALENLTFLAEQAARQWDFEDARKLYEKMLPLALKIGYEDNLLDDWHMCSWNSGMFEEALAIARQQVDLAIGNGDLQAAATYSISVSDCLIELGRLNEAAQVYEEALPFDSDGLLQLNYARFLADHDRWDKAVELYCDLLEGSDDDDPIFHHDLRSELAELVEMYHSDLSPSALEDAAPWLGQRR